jgi:3-methyladenine DNA glycosylase AlkC
LKSTDEKKYWQDYVAKQKDDIKKRVSHILNDASIKWEDKYEL